MQLSTLYYDMYKYAEIHALLFIAIARVHFENARDVTGIEYMIKNKKQI